MKNIKAIIFDMDGVLLDTERICQRAWAIAAKDFAVADSEYLIKKCIGTNKADSIKILKTECGSNFDAAAYLAKTSEVFHQIEETEGIPLKKYAREILEYLQPKYKIALASSTRLITVERQLKTAGLFDYFNTITTGDMVLHSKPDPEIYLKACSSIAMDPSFCAAIEDSPNGLKSAFAAGLSPVMVVDTVEPSAEIRKICKGVFYSLEELKKIL